MTAHPVPRRIGLAAVALAVAASAAGCGANGASRSNATPLRPGSSGLAGSESPTAGRPTGTAFGESYLAIVTPVNQGLAQMQAKLPTLGSSPSGAQLSQVVTPTLNDLQIADDTLSQIDWPPAAGNDVHAYLDADGALAGDLQTLQGGAAGTAASAEARLNQDIQTRNRAGQTLRSDLGVVAS